LKISGSFKVNFNGPFYTGFFIDTATLIDLGYSKVQNEVLESLLEEKDSEGWDIEGNKEDQDLLWDVAYTSIYGGTPMVPPSFLTKKVVYDEHIEFEGHKFVVRKALFHYHDYGVCVYRISVNVEINGELEAAEYRQLVERFNPQLTEIINPTIKKDTLLLKKKLSVEPYVTENVLQSYEEISKDLKNRASDFIPIRSALWYHRIFHVEHSETTELSPEIEREYHDLVFSSQRAGPQNCSLSPYAISMPSFGYSVMIKSKGKEVPDINIDRVVEVAQYYYAATSLLDTILFYKFADFSRKKSSEKLSKIKELEIELNEIKQLSDQLDLFLLGLKDTMVNFSPSSTLMWRNLEREWYYIPMVEGLKEKSELLNTKYAELLDELTDQRSQTLNKFVKIFTIFAIIGPLFEVYSFLHDNPEVVDFVSSISPLLIGLAIIPAIALLGIMGYFLFKELSKYY
jgi:hypothetical protein